MYTLHDELTESVWQADQTLVVSPASLVKKFGAPIDFDGYKSSGCYVFIDAQDHQFVVHDWKATNLYDDTLPAPETFWAGTEPEEFIVSSAGIEVGEFVRWMQGEVADDDLVGTHQSMTDLTASASSTQARLYLLQTLLGGVGLLIHLWTTWLAYEASGFWWACFYFVLFIYAELYWALKLWIAAGLNAYSIIAGGWALAYVAVLVFNFLKRPR